MKGWVIFSISLVLFSSLLGQRTGRKPVLIRPDETPQEGQEETLFVPDPLKAREHLEIGDFYYRRKNYEAAADRYREAVKNNPRWTKAYEKLIKVLETLEEFPEAILTCEQFIQTNGTSSDVKRFEKWSEKLRKKSSKTARTSGG